MSTTTSIDELIELLQEAKEKGSETVRILIIDSSGSTVHHTYYELGEVQPNYQNPKILELHND